MEDEKNMKCIYSILNKYFIQGLAIIILGFIFACLFPIIKIEGNEVSIVLGFVGVIATFIVVSNYAQVKDIEKKFNDKISVIEADRVKFENYSSFLIYYSMKKYWSSLNCILSVILNADKEECKEYIKTAENFFDNIQIKTTDNLKNISLGIGYKIQTQGKKIDKLMNIIDAMIIPSNKNDNNTDAPTGPAS